MGFARALRCRECGKEVEIAPKYVCEECFGPLEVTYDYAGIAKAMSRSEISTRQRTLWRYKELLPVDAENPLTLQEGFTPLLRARSLGKKEGIDVYLKNDCTNPTHSFKDRVVSMAVNKAREFGFTTVACPSTGNLANSVAAYAAAAGMRAYVFIPSNLERAKVLQSWAYGPTIVPVAGNYDDVNRLCTEIAGRYPWAFVNVNMRPYYSEGSKTMGFEIAEQMGWEAPDHIVVPVASGSLLTKIHKGMKEFEKLGFIEPFKTKMHVAQAAGCSPVTQAFRAKTLEIRPVKPSTIVKSLAIGNPADGYYALKVLQETGGAAESATDDEVRDAIQLLGHSEGVFAETAGGVVVACYLKLVQSGVIKAGERTVLVITGTGLKTAEVLEERAVLPEAIPANLAAFEKSPLLVGAPGEGRG